MLERKKTKRLWRMKNNKTWMVKSQSRRMKREMIMMTKLYSLCFSLNLSLSLLRSRLISREQKKNALLFAWIVILTVTLATNQMSSSSSLYFSFYRISFLHFCLILYSISCSYSINQLCNSLVLVGILVL